MKTNSERRCCIE